MREEGGKNKDGEEGRGENKEGGGKEENERGEKKSAFVAKLS